MLNKRKKHSSPYCSNKICHLSLKLLKIKYIKKHFFPCPYNEKKLTTNSK